MMLREDAKKRSEGLNSHEQSLGLFLLTFNHDFTRIHHINGGSFFSMSVPSKPPASVDRFGISMTQRMSPYILGRGCSKKMGASKSRTAA